MIQSSPSSRTFSCSTYVILSTSWSWRYTRKPRPLTLRATQSQSASRSLDLVYRECVGRQFISLSIASITPSTTAASIGKLSSCSPRCNGGTPSPNPWNWPSPVANYPQKGRPRRFRSASPTLPNWVGSAVSTSTSLASNSDNSPSDVHRRCEVLPLFDVSGACLFLTSPGCSADNYAPSMG